MGAHMLAIKDMAGLCRPFAAKKLVKALKEEVGIPIHFHTHDTSGIAAASVLEAADAGVDIVDLAIASMSGGTSQPNLNSIVAALQNTPRDTGSMSSAQRVLRLLGTGAQFYTPFDTAPKTGQRRGLSARDARRPVHQPQGAGHRHGPRPRWPEIARTYAEVNQLFGDIVKVTPSSKVVGDMALFLFSRGIKPPTS
jgi:pyruvate carboxylase